MNGILEFVDAQIAHEVKNTARIDLAGWAAEAELERRNDDANAALIVHKRYGKGRPEDQWVTCTLSDLVALLSGSRDHVNTREDQ